MIKVCITCYPAESFRYSSWGQVDFTFWNQFDKMLLFMINHDSRFLATLWTNLENDGFLVFLLFLTEIRL